MVAASVISFSPWIPSTSLTKNIYRSYQAFRTKNCTLHLNAFTFIEYKPPQSPLFMHQTPVQAVLLTFRLSHFLNTDKMVHAALFSLSLLLLILHSPETLAQAPAAAPVQAPPAPAPPAPAAPAQAPATTSAQVPPVSGSLDVVKILSKAGHFTVFIRLLSATQTDSELNTQLNNTNNGATIFAPSDNSFFNLKIGTLNSISDGQKAELAKFHIVPAFISSSQFQTQSNPVRTQAGTGGRLALNVTTTGSAVNITTGLTNATVTGTVYTDGRLAIYQVDKVLLPLDIFTPKPPAPAPGPAPEKPTKQKAPAVESPVIPNDTSGAGSFILYSDAALFLAVSTAAAILLSWI